MQECMITDKKIQILLSTYNGEKYLREQLDSFLTQEGAQKIKVLIRDDGSTDSTVKILHEYSHTYGFEVVTGENIGVNDSVFWLFSHCDLSCDYFALSDQDDVWLREKLITASKCLSNLDEKQPALFASCSEIVDEELNSLGGTLFPKKGISFFNAMVQNITPGHTQVFNRAMMKELIEKGISDVHVIDWWLYLVATGIGEVYFSKNFTVKHRQHGKNTEGYELSFWKKLKKRIKKIRTDKGNSISLQLFSFYKRYEKCLSDRKRKELEYFFSSQKTILSRVKYALIGQAYRQTLMETWIFKVLYIFGKYNI